MPQFRVYDREAAVAYARRYAFQYNKAYYDFTDIGGDCTNFASQCLFAGAGTMNFTPVMGWYYRNASDRTAAWTGVQYLYNFLVGNRGAGPFGETVPLSSLQIGDLVQLGNSNEDFYHTPVVTGFSRGEPLLAAHTYDAFDRPLSSYAYATVRFIHIIGVRD